VVGILIRVEANTAEVGGQQAHFLDVERCRASDVLDTSRAAAAAAATSPRSGDGGEGPPGPCARGVLLAHVRCRPTGEPISGAEGALAERGPHGRRRAREKPPAMSRDSATSLSLPVTVVPDATRGVVTFLGSFDLIPGVSGPGGSSMLAIFADRFSNLAHHDNDVRRELTIRTLARTRSDVVTAADCYRCCCLANSSPRARRVRAYVPHRRFAVKRNDQ